MNTVCQSFIMRAIFLCGLHFNAIVNIYNIVVKSCIC